MTPVESSQIAAIGHDPETNEMHVQFHSGATHVYAGVTAEKHAAMMGAESIGAHFHEHVRNRHDQRRVS